jgi:membrane associated rhomboid family serine protease
MVLLVRVLLPSTSLSSSSCRTPAAVHLASCSLARRAPGLSGTVLRRPFTPGLATLQRSHWPIYALVGCNLLVAAFYFGVAQEDPWARRLMSRNAVLSNSRFWGGGGTVGRFARGRWGVDEYAPRPWVALTSAFTHFDLLHLGVNMLTLWSFGPIVLDMLGTRRFLALYLASAAGGSLAHLLYSDMVPRSSLPASRVVRRDDAAVGASAALSGITMYYVARVPQGKTILLILPVPNSLLLPLFLGGSLYAASVGDRSWGHAAHLGGAAVGIGYAVARMVLRR